MEETILVPSPNWFQVSGLAVSTDGWLIYGGPSKSLCVLEPLLTDDGVIEGNQRYKAHVNSKAHKEKIVSVDIHPEWPTKRNIITGSADGAVKEFCVEKTSKDYIITYIRGHEAHYNEKEEIIGVGYSTDTIAITMGTFNNIIKWDLNTNVVKAYNMIRKFKPTCISCSQHIPLQVAIGTKQGVIFVVDLTGPGKIIYKVRGQDDDVLTLTWCPQYEVTLRKKLSDSTKRFTAMERINRIRNEPELADVEPLEAFGIEQKLENLEVSDTDKKFENLEVSDTDKKLENLEVSDTDKKLENLEASGIDKKLDNLEGSGTEKKLPEDSFDDSVIVQEDDMFDIYKDHEADEFGHKKYVPEEVYVKVQSEEEPKEKQDDFLAECLKLKDDILKKKNEPEPSIESLVEKLDNAHVTDASESSSSKIETVGLDTASVHIHKHLLASVARHGGIRIWSKSGKLVSTCHVPTSVKNGVNTTKAVNWPTVYWHKADSLLIADGRNQLLECNPLKMDCRNKLEWRIIHALHRRGLYCIKSDAPRVQTMEMTSDPHYDDNWSVWTAAQDRHLIRYDIKKNKKLAIHETCGGFLYDIKVCPYDASKLAIGVGDGAVRVWESGTNEDETKLVPGTVTTFWQNVQGKVLTVAWHPTKENLLAFSTAESRVGLIDTRSKQEKPAKVLLPALNYGVYSMCWGNNMELYACGGGNIVIYHANKPNESPVPMPVEVEGQKWDICSVLYSSRGLLVGSNLGGVALLSGKEGDVIAATFVYSKLIYSMEWHPQQTSTSDEESQYKNLLAVCSVDKQNNIAILHYKDKEGGGKEFLNHLWLSGHEGSVLHLSWNPHTDGQLLSTSQDGTVRIWNLPSGECTAIFNGHKTGSFGATWCAQPALRDHVLSGGGDCALRLWNVTQHPAESYEAVENEKAPSNKKKNKSYYKKLSKGKHPEQAQVDNIASIFDYKRKGSKRYLFPWIQKQILSTTAAGVQTLIHSYLETHKDIKILTQVLNDMPLENENIKFLKMFGNINGLNELLEVELAYHLEGGNYEAYIVVLIFRGHIDAMIQFANKHDLLDPFLLSIAPCVSFKYWKDVTQLYLVQIDRIIAKGDVEKLGDSKQYGGPVYRKAIILLSIHDVKGAVDVLVEGNLYKEAYILCKLRHMDSIAEETLSKWASYCYLGGNLVLATICYLALGDVSRAATILGKSNEQEDLNLAAELAKTAGHNTFADHVEKKAKNKEEKTTTEEILEELPKRIELLLKDVKNNDTGIKNIGDSIIENNGVDGVSGIDDKADTNVIKEVDNETEVNKATNNNCVES